MMFCSRCFNKPVPGAKKDDGEWMEPTRRKSGGRGPSPSSSGGDGRGSSSSSSSKESNAPRSTTLRREVPKPKRASIKFEDLKAFNMEDNNQRSIRWDNSINTGPGKGLGDISMSGNFSDDSISRGLGGFSRGPVEDDSSISSGGSRNSSGGLISISEDDEDASGAAPSPRKPRKSMFKGGRKTMTKMFDLSHEDSKSSVTSKGKGRKSLFHAGKMTMGIAGMNNLSNRSNVSNESEGEGFPGTRKARRTLMQGRKTLMKMQLPMDFLKSSNEDEEPSPQPIKQPAVTSIAVLTDGFFLTASRGERAIKMYKSYGEGKVKFVREFEGHKSSVVALVTLDRKGRFLSAGMDKTVRLWDSRFDCEEEVDDEGKPLQEPMVLLATFKCFARLIHSIEVLAEGSYVRPTDDIDMAMVAAVAKKTVLEGAASLQRAAVQREIIQCSGSFATLSRNDKKIMMWQMNVAEKSDENLPPKDAAKIDCEEELEHEASIGTMTSSQNMILAGDTMGVVIMWKRSRQTTLNWGSKKSKWKKCHKFTPWKTGVLQTPEEVTRQSILKLCLLDKETFVIATRAGTVRVWDNIGSADGYEVHRKNHTSSAKITSETVTDIRKLPPIEDPNTGESCLGFSVSSTDGHVMSMAVYPREFSVKRKSEDLVMFHVFDGGGSNATAAIESIAVLPGYSSTNGDSFDSVLVTGDGIGNVKTLKPEWAAMAIC